MGPSVEVCPSCGTARDGTRAKPKGLKAYTPYFIGGGVVIVIAVLAFFGGLFGPSGKTFCTATLNQARDFGAISPSATLASTSADSTDTKNRKSCIAKVGEDSYTLVADIKSVDIENKPCHDFIKQKNCVALYSVARSDGVTTYQVREIPPGDTDEALTNAGLLGTPPVAAPQNGASAAPAGDARQAAPAGDSGNGFETETSVDNSGSMPNGQSQQQQAPQQ